MLPAEFTEVSQIDLRMEVKRQFAFLSSDGFKFAAVKGPEGDAVLFELCLNATADQQFHLSITDVPTAKKITVVDVEDTDGIKDVYANADVIKRQILMLDPVYANIFASEPIFPPIVNLSLAPANIHSKVGSLLAIVTKAGVCEVRALRRNLRRYDHVLVDISSTWRACCTVRHPEKFNGIDSLTEYYSDLVFTATCWCDKPRKDNRLNLFCGTRSGLILSFDIHDSRVDILFISKSGLGSIAFLKYLACGDNTRDELVFAASMNGTLKVFLKNRDSELSEGTFLWEEKDRMTFRCLEAFYDKNSDRIIAATCKTSFFMVFLLSRKGQVLNTATHYVGIITGIQHFENNQFIVCTLNASTTILTLCWPSDEITIEQENIKNDFDSKVYAILGMATTKNKVGWLFLQSPIKVFERSFNNRTTITVCSFNRVNALTVMETKVTSKIYEFRDCAEILRCTFAKFGPPEVPFELNYNGDEVDESYIRSLKIAAAVLFVRLSTFRKRIRSEDAKQTEKDLSGIRKILETYTAYRRLSLLVSIKMLSREQSLSAGYYRKKLFEFSQDETNHWLGHLRFGFVQTIAELLGTTEAFSAVESEQCAYCELKVDFRTGFCKEEHKVPRCCFTFLQIPILCARSCEVCQYATIDDDSLVKQVMYPGEEIACPLCDGPLLRAKSRLFISKHIE